MAGTYTVLDAPTGTMLRLLTDRYRLHDTLLFLGRLRSLITTTLRCRLHTFSALGDSFAVGMVTRSWHHSAGLGNTAEDQRGDGCEEVTTRFAQQHLGSQTICLLKILQPKTRLKAARHQATQVEASDLVQIIACVFEKLDREEPLLPGSNQNLRRRMDRALERLGIPVKGGANRALDLGSLRIAANRGLGAGTKARALGVAPRHGSVFARGDGIHLLG